MAPVAVYGVFEAVDEVIWVRVFEGRGEGEKDPRKLEERIHGVWKRVDCGAPRFISHSRTAPKRILGDSIDPVGEANMLAFDR